LVRKQNTYCCYAYHFYAYWLYFIYVWHVYVSPKTYKCFGTFIIKDSRYTFTFFTFSDVATFFWPSDPVITIAANDGNHKH
jgi:hypothetical protein